MQKSSSSYTKPWLAQGLLTDIGSTCSLNSKMLAMDNPVCEERFYLDDWKPAARQQQMSDSDAEQTWRRLSSNESYEEQNTWSPQTAGADNRFHIPKPAHERE